MHFRSDSPDWATPQDLFDDLDAEFHFATDVCATAENAKCEQFYTREDDGLAQDWQGVCFCNPPYGRVIGQWIQRAYAASLEGATVVCLIPSRTDTAWWQDYVVQAREIRYLRGRVKFGGAKNSAPFASAVAVFGPR